MSVQAEGSLECTVEIPYQIGRVLETIERPVSAITPLARQNMAATVSLWLERPSVVELDRPLTRYGATRGLLLSSGFASIELQQASMMGGNT